MVTLVQLIECLIVAQKVTGLSPVRHTKMPTYSIKEVGRTVNPLSFDSLGALPRVGTINLGVV